MKKLIPILLIICLLLPSCQLKKVQTEDYIFTTVAETTEESATFVFEETTDITFSEKFNETASAVLNTLSSATSTQAKTTKAYTTATKPYITTTKIHTVPSTAKTTTANSASTKPATTAKVTTVPETNAPESSAELRGIWISCYDYTSAAGKTRTEYKAVTDAMFKNIKDLGLNTAFVHLRAFSDAFYKSEIYPYSAMIAGKEGADLTFDPFEVLLESAEKHGISVHGWINPFRVSTKNDTSLLSSKNPAKAIIDAGNKNGEICILANGIYYNPSHTENHKRIIDGVREIVSKYDIDGIHIDDYFYPSTEEKIDKTQYSQYKAEGGTLSLSEWRNANVNSFVSALYSAVKSYNSNLTVSISPAGNLEENYTKHYADVKLWLSSKGYADLIIPQIYFGFEHQTLGFEKLLRQWSNLPRNSSVKLACGFAAYKCNTADNYAGTGKKEWQQNTDILSRQLNSVRNNQSYSGFAVFSYKDLTRTSCKTEIANLKDTLNTGK